MNKVDCYSCNTVPHHLFDKITIENPDDEYLRGRMEFLNELCYCWSQGCLSDLAAFTAAKIIISPEPMTEEMRNWMIGVVSKAEGKCL